jgi:hypothetical protein
MNTMTPTKRQLLDSILQQAGEVAERYYQAADALYHREREFHEVVGPALKAAASLTGIKQDDLARATGISKGSWIAVFTGRAVPLRRKYIEAVRLLTGETPIPPVGTAGPAVRTP